MDAITQESLLKLAEWSEPQELQTKHGPRIIRRASPTEEFSEVWKTRKAEVKALGAGFSKDRDGNWELTWWQELPEDVKAARAQAVSESKAASAEIELPKPDGLDYLPFQKAGIRYALARANVLIADEMGLGKTIQAIGIVNSDPKITSVIVVCPKSLKLNWKREFEKWSVRGLSIGIADKDFPTTEVVIINYEILGKHLETIKGRQWGACIVDEAHYIKNKKTQRSNNVKSIPSDRKIRLTGTPIVNRPIELFNLITDLDPQTFGNFWKFAKRYASAHYNGYGYDFGGASNLDELQRRLRETIMVRRVKSQVLTELPPKIRQVIEVEIDDPEQRKAVQAEISYQKTSEPRIAALREDVRKAGEQKETSPEVYEAAVKRLTEATQIDFQELSRLRHETALAKVPAVTSHVETCLEDNDNKIILAAHHHDVIDQLKTALAPFHPVVITGANSAEERQAAVDSFQTDPQVRVIIASIQAAGVGITLTASSQVVFAELDWVPGNVSQMEDRAHRIGQQTTVLVQHIVLDGSIDAKMAKTIVEKQFVIDQALDAEHPERKAPPKPAPVIPPVVKSVSPNGSDRSETPKTEPDKTVPPAKDTPADPDLTVEQVKAIHRGLRILASYDPDYAAQLNGIGFNRFDGEIGHSLAEAVSLSPKQALLGLKLVRRYCRQLPEDLLTVLHISEK